MVEAEEMAAAEAMVEEGVVDSAHVLVYALGWNIINDTVYRVR